MTIFIQITTDSLALYEKLCSHPDARQPTHRDTPFGSQYRVIFHAPESLQAALQGEAPCHWCDGEGFIEHHGNPVGYDREPCKECR